MLLIHRGWHQWLAWGIHATRAILDFRRIANVMFTSLRESTAINVTETWRPSEILHEPLGSVNRHVVVAIRVGGLSLSSKNQESCLKILAGITECIAQPAMAVLMQLALQ